MLNDIRNLCELALGDTPHQRAAHAFGAFSSVYVGEAVVIKCYPTEYQRDRAMEVQRLAAEIGLGPEVYGVVNIDSSGYPFGYISEKVECDGSKINTMMEKNIKRFQDVRDAIERLARKRGVYGCFIEALLADARPCNFGLKDGRIVLIDFCCW